MLVALSVTAAACGGSGGSGGSGGGNSGDGGGDGAAQRDGTTGVSGTAVHGETLTIGAQAAAPTMNPAKADVAFDFYTGLAYDSLVYRASDGSLEPGLAAGWQYVDEQNTAFEIELRDGVTFTDGSALTAEAVKASLEYMHAAGGGTATYLDGVDIEVTGPSTLVLRSSEPNPMWPDLLTSKYILGQVISPAGVADPDILTVEQPSVGAGAYVYDPADSVADDHYTYRANPDYYEPERQHYDEIVVRVFTDPQAAINALQTGQVDIAPGGPEVVAQAESAGLQIVHTAFVWNGLNLIDRAGDIVEPLGDVRVRQAMNHAVDREAVTEAVLGEYGVPTGTVQIEGGEGWSEKAADYYDYDVDKAKELLAEAGYPDGFELPVLTAQFSGYDVMTEAIKGQLAEVGIEVEPLVVTPAEGATYVTKRTDGSFGAVEVGYGAQPMFIMGPGLFLDEAEVFNPFGSAPPELQQLYDEAARAPEAERRQLHEDILMYLTENAWFLPVTFGPVFYYARADLGGVQVSAGSPTANPLDWYDTK